MLIYSLGRKIILVTKHACIDFSLKKFPCFDLFLQVNPEDILFGGWDISSMNMADTMDRAKVLDIDLQKQLRGHMESMMPLPRIYNPDFIAVNQGSRANNIMARSSRTSGTQLDHENQKGVCSVQDLHSTWNGTWSSR